MALATDEGIDPPKTPTEDADLQKVYQEYLQKCCEVGQITYNLDQLSSQQRELEKNLEITERAVKNSATKHRELQKAKFSKLKPVEEPKIQLTEEAKQ